jgi:hypothetical protein
MKGRANVELDRPRSATELLGVTFQLYGRYPLLFPILAAGVVVPYLLIVLAITGQGPFEHRHLSFVAGQLLSLSDVILVWPLVSALHVHAVRDVADGKEPHLVDVARRGLVGLPVVSAAVAITWVATTIGFFALFVPGVFLVLRWAVVAQTAALEGGSWRDALRRSANFTEDNYLHILGLFLLSWLVVGLPSFLIGLLLFRNSDTTVVSFLVATTVWIIQSSFGALTTAVLFFDLKAPGRVMAAGFTPTGEPIAHPVDPRIYSDQDRPAGWYIDPASPKHMRYWAADRERLWSQRTARTPKQTLHEWKELLERGEDGGPMAVSGGTVEPTGHPLDPASYSDKDRPPGWYVDPDSPWSMRYWAADGTPTWGKRKAKTPKQVLAGWRDLRWTR